MTKKRTSTSHDLQFHQELFFCSSRENAKTKRKRSRQVGEFMFNKKRACYIYGTKLWIERPLSEATSIFLGANTDESVTLPTANLIKLFLGSLFLKCRISKSKSASSSNSDVSFFIVSSINWFPKRVFITKGLNQHQNAIRQFIYPASLKFASMMEYLINETNTSTMMHLREKNNGWRKIVIWRQNKWGKNRCKPNAEKTYNILFVKL